MPILKPAAVVAALLSVLAPCEAALADGWAMKDGPPPTAGNLTGGQFGGLWFSCSPGGKAEAVFSGAGWRFQPGAAYTVVLSIDGTAYVLASTVRADPATGASVLVHSASLAALAPVIDALRGGKAVEVSAPAGRYSLKLAGSGKALGAFRQACAG